MARSTRASLLLIALGVATLLVTPPANAAAANSGGAAPGGEAVAVSSGSSSGGAAPGVDPQSSTRSSSSAQTGGAIVGVKPRRPAARRRTATRRATTRKVVRRKATRRAQTRRKVTRAPQRKVRAPEAPASEPETTVPTVAGVFPVQGSYSFGGDDGRFGAGRPGHRHQGQDVAAANGTPLVAPVAGTVIWKANQPSGAGIYLVIRGAADQRDYVFMHLKRGSVLVTPGQTVAAGQQIAQVGSTGASSGPHLHFEIWVGGWGARDGAPIDPLPQLRRWAGLA